jgi:hypothetical protein
MSTKPGVTSRPSASISRVADPGSGPPPGSDTAVIVPSVISTSPV